MLAAVVLAAVIVVPGFVLLYVLDHRGLIPEEGVDDVADPDMDRALDNDPHLQSATTKDSIEEPGR